MGWWWLLRDERPLVDDVVLPRWVQWVIGLFLVITLAIFVWVIGFNDRQLDPEERTEIAALEDTLRPRGAAEDTVGRYEAVMQQIADELSATQPGLAWRWAEPGGSSGCGGEFEDTSGAHLFTRRLVANRLIPADALARAQQGVRDHATRIDVSYVSGFELRGGAGGAIDLTQGDVAVLSGVTPCQLRRDDL